MAARMVRIALQSFHISSNSTSDSEVWSKSIVRNATQLWAEAAIK
jgi:hypothetical protein